MQTMWLPRAGLLTNLLTPFPFSPTIFCLLKKPWFSFDLQSSGIETTLCFFFPRKQRGKSYRLMTINHDEDAWIVTWTLNTGYYLLRRRQKSSKWQWCHVSAQRLGGSSYEVKCKAMREGLINSAHWLCSGPTLIPLQLSKANSWWVV